MTIGAVIYIKEKIYYLQIINGSFTEEFRRMEFSEETIEVLKEYAAFEKVEKENGKGQKKNWIEQLTAAMIESEFSLTKAEQLKNGGKKDFSHEMELFESLNQKYEAVFADLEYFPMGEDEVGMERVAYDNSWYGVRTYGGERVHEGTDIMTSNNERGYFPVYSMTDGIVEKKGWLKLGGWRLGIRAPSGGYFYYAHLYDYEESLEEGDTVKAGQLLGYAGDSGYSETEGEVGHFDVHLHLGIYIEDSVSGQEISVNPYWILRLLEDRKIPFFTEEAGN